MRSKGGFPFIRGGSYQMWTMLFPGNSSTTTPLFVDINQFGAGSSAYSSLLVPKTLWLPSPIASDSFVRSNGALGVTDGNGTQERNGGAGLAWNAPGWVVSGNTAIAGNTVVADGVTSGLVGWWKLDNAGGPSTAIDSGSGGNNGSSQGAVVIGGSANRFANANKATTFDGSSQWIDVPVGSGMQLGNSLSLSAWVYPTSVGEIQGSDIVSKGYSTNSPFISYSLEWTLDNSFRFGTGAASFDTLSSSLNGYALNRWYHVVCTYDGSTKTIYVNGAKSISQAYSSTIVYNTQDISIGTWFDSHALNYFPGTISDVRIYSRAITSSEVVQIYLAGSLALCTNSTANVVAETAFTGSTSQSGLVLNYDGSTGTNLLTSYFDGNGNVKVDQIVNGNATNLISGAVTYVANARLLTVSAPSEGQVRVYYNNSFVNSSTGIWPGFTNSTRRPPSCLG